MKLAGVLGLAALAGCAAGARGDGSPAPAGGLERAEDTGAGSLRVRGRLVHPDGSPAVGYEVRLVGEADPRVGDFVVPPPSEVSATSAADGTLAWRFDPEPWPRYRAVVVEHPLAVLRELGHDGCLPGVPIHGRLEVGELVLRPSGALRVRTVDESGASLRGWRVFTRLPSLRQLGAAEPAPNHDGSALVDPVVGVATIRGLSPGTKRLWASREPGPDGERRLVRGPDAVVREGEVTEVELVVGDARR